MSLPKAKFSSLIYEFVSILPPCTQISSLIHPRSRSPRSDWIFVAATCSISPKAWSHSWFWILQLSLHPSGLFLFTRLKLGAGKKNPEATLPLLNVTFKRNFWSLLKTFECLKQETSHSVSSEITSQQSMAHCSMHLNSPPSFLESVYKMIPKHRWSLFCLHILIYVFTSALLIFLTSCPFAWHQVIFYTCPVERWPLPCSQPRKSLTHTHAFFIVLTCCLTACMVTALQHSRWVLA